MGMFAESPLVHMTLPGPHAELLEQHLDYKMPDQRLAKRWDSGTFTGRMAAPLPLLSCNRATVRGSLEAETYAILEVWSALQLVAWKQSSAAKHRKWRNTCKHKFWSNLPQTVYLCIWIIYTCEFPGFHDSLDAV